MWGKGNTYSLLVWARTDRALCKSLKRFLKKPDTDLPHVLDISLLDIYPKNSISYQRNICLSMFTAALFIIVRKWKHPRCLLMDERIM